MYAKKNKSTIVKKYVKMSLGTLTKAKDVKVSINEDPDLTLDELPEQNEYELSKNIQILISAAQIEELQKKR